MLVELRIKNFAIIESLTLPLAPGFNALSGETGAGKSIIVGALGMLLGDRPNADVIRAGADRAVVEGTFDLSERVEIAAAFADCGIEIENSVVVAKREVSANGRARAWINATPVGVGVLVELGRLLVNLHGQHEAQTLLDAAGQRRVLDAFAGAGEFTATVRRAHEGLAAVGREITDLARRKGEAERRSDYLRHVVREIDEAKLVAGDDERLEEDARRLEHAEELRSLAADVSAGIEGGEQAILERLGAVGRSLSAIQRIDPSLARLQEPFDAAFYALESLATDLVAYGRALEMDPSRLEEVRHRRDVLFRLTKKYGATAADILATGARAREELDLVDSAGLDLRALERRRGEASEALASAAATLTEARRESSERLAAAVSRELPGLGLPDGKFFVTLTPLSQIGPDGAEDVVFCVALNVGHDARPLARVASGGELSRVMLALTTILARLDRVPTLVFDEVDSGIGGRVGLQVGAALRRAANDHQVFAITHLPQIASRAHHHIVVSKGERGGVTTADVAVVGGEERVAELARMLGGDPESVASRTHARELLAHEKQLETHPPSPAPSRTRPAQRRRPR